MSADKAKTQALKDLRASRRQWVDQATAESKFQKKTIKAIQQVLEEDAATVPQIAEAVGLPTEAVLWFVAGLKKYGQIVEAGQDDSYFRYALAAGRQQDDESAEVDARTQPGEKP
ncbi:MAG: winged helix-turn-helix domain-containing protein [Deltaproteobacteria bacterium]|nr:winged helix-turn-helix domain-containing protein [Deltaproteobacteria bacterium]